VSAPVSSLFRKEVTEWRQSRLHGDVDLATPISWQVIGFSLLGGLALAIFFIATASYSRVENVQGTIVLDQGVATIVPSRSGRIAQLSVGEGETVRAGQALAQIRSEEDTATGGSGPQRVIEALRQEDREIVNQSTSTAEASGAEQSRLAAQMRGIEDETRGLDLQIAAQRRLVQVAESEFADVQRIAGRGYISRRDVEAREVALILRRQQLAQLEQSRAAKLADHNEAARGMASAAATARAQLAALQSGRAQLGQRLAEATNARGYTITAPVGGTVTALTARLGQPVEPQQSLMVVRPANARARVELYVPTQAAGFLAIGQDVRLAVDAFPYQRFGVVAGHIAQVSSVADPRAAPNGESIAVYLVTVDLERPSVWAFGRWQPLLPGMTVNARVITQKQTLLEWLFEPVLAVRSR
jgi:membrane fusion protein